MSRPFRLGLTGSIGMGKSTTAQLFADEGVSVWDADDAVHRLYAPGAAGAEAIKSIAPDCVGPTGVDRTCLKTWISEDPNRLKMLEAEIHPLVTADREAFLSTSKDDIVLLDIPLLYETGADQMVDAVVVVSVPYDVQRARVLSRVGMTDAHFNQILTRQMPDSEKRARADFVILTKSLESARRQVQNVLEQIRGEIDA